MKIALVGLPGSGKSTVGRVLAEELGCTFWDLDERVAQAAGRSIPEIFRREGEEGFRRREAQALREALAEAQDVVIAAGGGIVERPSNRRLLHRRALCLYLHAPLEALLGRVGAGEGRPLLSGDPAGALAALAARRVPLYRQAAHFELDASGPVEDVAARAASLARVRLLSPGVYLGAGLRARVAEAAPGCEGWLVVSSRPVYERFGRDVEAALQASGRPWAVALVPDGEEAKRLSVVASVYEEAARLRITRQGTVIALGGGTVGDLAGFVAATYLRGIGLVQVPTTLLAQVDASLGGKVGVDLPAGKNLVGAFYPPRAVLLDPQVLEELPADLWREGLAEVVKHAIIGDPILFRQLEDLQVPPPGPYDELVARGARVKLRIVARDPREEGVRAHLNLGHTFAHAFEQVSGYRIRHGLAVAVGLWAASRLGEELEGFAERRRLERLLAHLGLPTRLPGLSPEAALAAMGQDKKRRGGRLRFVVPRRIGDVTIRDDVPEDLVRSVLREVGEA